MVCLPLMLFDFSPRSLSALSHPKESFYGLEYSKFKISTGFMTKLGQKQDLVEDKEKKTSWSKVWAVCCLCLSTSLSRSMLKLRGNNQDAGKALSKKIEMFLSRKIQPACYRRRLWPARQVPRRLWDPTFVV